MIDDRCACATVFLFKRIFSRSINVSWANTKSFARNTWTPKYKPTTTLIAYTSWMPSNLVFLYSEGLPGSVVTETSSFTSICKLCGLGQFRRRPRQDLEHTFVCCSWMRLDRRWWLTNKNVLLLLALEFVFPPRSVPRPRTVLRVFSVHRSEIA